MNTVTLTQPGKKSLNISIPASWNELSLHELRRVALHQLMPYPKGAEELRKPAIMLDIFKYRMLKAFKRQILAKKRAAALIEKMDAEDFGMAQADLLKWMWQENQLTRLPMATIKVPGIAQPCKVPAADFNDLLVGEFEDAEIFFALFNSNKNHDHLMQLAATLLKPERVYNKHYSADKMLPHFNRMPADLLFIVYLWYAACRSLLPKLFPLVYGGGAGGESVTAPDLTAFTKCIHAGAGPENGTREQIRALPIKEFLFDMQLKAKAAKDLQAEMDAVRR